MHACSQCGSTNLVVRISNDQILTQERDGTWTDRGFDGPEERAVWYCGDCDNRWEDCFEEDLDEGESE